MRQTEMLQEVRKMRFEEIYGTWTEISVQLHKGQGADT